MTKNHRRQFVKLHVELDFDSVGTIREIFWALFIIAALASGIVGLRELVEMTLNLLS